MPIETDFRFRHAKPFSGFEASHAGADVLGLLRGLVGESPTNEAKRIWQGSGFNMIWRPNFGNASGSQPHFLQLNMTTETLSFTEISGKDGIANRGLLQKDIFLGGVAYLQTINDSFDNSGQHFEPGVFNFVPRTSDPNEPPTVVRMGSIPHGTTINMQGTAFEVPQPQFDPVSITPFVIGDESALVPFPEEDLGNVVDSRTDLTRVTGLTQAQLTNPNLLLSEAVVGQSIARTTVLVLSTDSTVPGSIPDAGGGVDNIAFLIGTANGPNAIAPKVTSTFWVEEGIDHDGSPLIQLQYTQRVLLDFAGLSWPHVTVATLRPVI